MFCPKCGTQLGNNDTFCPGCGASAQNSFSGAVDSRSRVADNQYSMNWFKFLIYFGLFAGAVLNVITGIQMLTGAQYDGYEDLVYAVFDGLQTVDVLVGIALLALAAFGIYARMRLAGYYQNGPKLLTYVYAGSVVISLLYIIGVNIVLGDAAEDLDISSMVTSMVMSAVMIFANKTYFKKRESLFVN